MFLPLYVVASLGLQGLSKAFTRMQTMTIPKRWIRHSSLFIYVALHVSILSIIGSMFLSQLFTPSYLSCNITDGISSALFISYTPCTLLPQKHFVHSITL